MNCNKTKLQVSKPIYPNNNINLITAEIIPSIPIYNNDIAPLPPLLEIYTTHYIPHTDQLPYIPHRDQQKYSPIFPMYYLVIPMRNIGNSGRNTPPQSLCNIYIYIYY